MQLALNRLERGKMADSAFLETQRVADWLLAFWGSVDDKVADVERRDLMKVGKYSERLDLMLRLDFPDSDIEHVVPRLLSHTKRVAVLLNEGALEGLYALNELGLEKNRSEALKLVNSLH